MAESRLTSLSPIPDWEAFRTKPLSLSPQQLDSYSQSRVDASTIEIAKSLCKSFPLYVDAKHHLGRTFRYPPTIENESERTDKNLISDIAESEEGLSLLGVLGVLTEHYDDKSVATIFNELAEWAKLPADLVPTMQQWQTVVKVLGCKLGSDEFSTAVDTYTKLGQGSASQGLQHTDGSAVAAVLNIMSDIIHGQHSGVCIAFVGKDAGWLAAVAEWLFNLNFELRSIDDRILYVSDGAEIQISIRFKPPGVPTDGLPIEDVPLVVREREQKQE